LIPQLALPFDSWQFWTMMAVVEATAIFRGASGKASTGRTCLTDFSHSDSNGSGSEDSNKSSGFAGPKLQIHGEQPTVGGTSHPNGCTPCAFYCFKRSGCKLGEDCTYCHMSHISNVRLRNDKWKKGQREKRCITRVARASAHCARLAESQACKPVFQEVPLQGGTTSLEHLATVAKALVDHTANAAATAKLKQTVPKFSRAPGTKVSANCPALHLEAAASYAAMSTGASMLAAMQRLQKLNLSFNGMPPNTSKVSTDLQPLQPPGNRGTNISKQNLELRPDEPCWLAYC